MRKVLQYIYNKVSESNYLGNNGRWRTTSITTTPVVPTAACATPKQLSAQPDQLDPPTQPGQQSNGVLNCSHFTPECPVKPEEDAEAHLLRTNDWMENHNFPEMVKVQRFCLTLTGEARLWYGSFRHIMIDWKGLQDQFRQQYSKIGNTGE